jgi:hypothetical protein
VAIESIAREMYNPFVGLMAKIKHLPLPLQQSAVHAVAQQIGGYDEDTLVRASQTLKGVCILSTLVNGDMEGITFANRLDKWLEMTPYITQPQVVFEGPDQLVAINQLRAQQGLPPIERKTNDPGTQDADHREQGVSDVPHDA